LAAYMMNMSEGLKILDIPKSFIGGDGVINPVLLWDSESVVLIDTGFPGQADLFIDAIEETGSSLNELSHILITHQDLDHIGSLSSLQKMASEHLMTVSHCDEKPYIEFTKMPIKMTPERITQIEKKLQGKINGTIVDMLEELKSKVNNSVKDGDYLDICGGIDVIHTPGHTPGHLCYYLKKYKTVVVGDALNLVNGVLEGPDPNFTNDMDLATQSLEKLLELDFENIICYHGGLLKDDAKAKLELLCNIESIKRL